MWLTPRFPSVFENSPHMCLFPGGKPKLMFQGHLTKFMEVDKYYQTFTSADGVLNAQEHVHVQGSIIRNAFSLMGSI